MGEADGGVAPADDAAATLGQPGACLVELLGRLPRLVDPPAARLVGHRPGEGATAEQHHGHAEDQLGDHDGEEGREDARVPRGVGHPHQRVVPAAPEPVVDEGESAEHGGEDGHEGWDPEPARQPAVQGARGGEPPGAIWVVESVAIGQPGLLGDREHRAARLAVDALPGKDGDPADPGPGGARELGRGQDLDGGAPKRRGDLLEERLGPVAGDEHRPASGLGQEGPDGPEEPGVGGEGIGEGVGVLDEVAEDHEGAEALPEVEVGRHGGHGGERRLRRL